MPRSSRPPKPSPASVSALDALARHDPGQHDVGDGRFREHRAGRQIEDRQVASVGEPEHASRVRGSAEADDLGAGHDRVRAAWDRGGRSCSRRRPAPDRRPSSSRRSISAAIASASRGKSLNPITEPPYQPIFCATDDWNLSRTRQSGPSVLITPTRSGWNGDDLNHGTLCGDRFGLAAPSLPRPPPASL